MTRTLPTKKLGNQIEALVCDYLRQRKLKFIERNYQCRLGEIDLIMSDQSTLVFIEVRYRQRHHFGSSLESVNLIKQNKIIKTAEYYLLSQQLSEKITCRFDVVGVKPPTNKLLGNISKLDSAQVEWIKNAFSR
ncbi:YraN family protein [Candidatus Rickettsiella isopodorum]|jgi:putative endonuclease|uniref:YraN family protein n=1 Tax=Candidatus Rickettsiella isopodorum TaxID=1225476 RepID=UPI0008FD09A3|nr:YraN family protein [Candidatus Rickettsiella isopodorum]